ncbi:MAG TPA: 1,4-dihydroxy-2-naphthoate polyprenyltransferase, partial [Propionibacteriaceae bacterium]|nr:1,4-dihydroxy-2-naphthoate polyprenyltransferase [Propionibacteriaceae bacterium]
NLRDVHTDVHVGKRTLATRLGDARTRWFYVILVAVAAAGVVVVAALTTWWALLGWAMIPLLIPCVTAVLGGVSGLALIRVLKLTGLAELACGLGLLVGVLIGT